MDFGEVAVESLVVIAGLLKGTELAELPGTHLAAAAGIQHVAGASRALQRLRGTLAGVRAGLRFYLEGRQAMERVSFPQASQAGVPHAAQPPMPWK